MDQARCRLCLVARFSPTSARAWKPMSFRPLDASLQRSLGQAEADSRGRIAIGHRAGTMPTGLLLNRTRAGGHSLDTFRQTQPEATRALALFTLALRPVHCRWCLATTGPLLAGQAFQRPSRTPRRNGPSPGERPELTRPFGPEATTSSVARHRASARPSRNSTRQGWCCSWRSR